MHRGDNKVAFVLVLSKFDGGAYTIKEETGKGDYKEQLKKVEL